MFTNLFETHVNVLDLDRSMAFYGETLELELGTVDETRRIAFYFIGGWNRTMLGLWEKAKEEIHSQHLAFEAPADELEETATKLRRKGIVTLDFFGRVSKSPTVFGWMPAASYYFNDPDGHSLEIIARLPGEPDPDRTILSWDEWQDG